MNRLNDATSPYLLQHKENPVDWWPWCDEAFAEAKRLNRPVLLSVGYAACHWCHVMAHESFEDGAIAAAMNADFICVKVDREERPDVDAVYMDAVQALTGQGGWPMTVFCTPEGAPFYAGTYFPPADRPGMPGFPRILAAVAEAWRERPGELARAGQQVVEQLSRLAQLPGEPGELDPALLDEAAARLCDGADLVHGGFGGAPKFPPALGLEFLLRHHARTADARSRRVVDLTCERMARGGIYDQLAGGFARYSVDERWAVPHFEKMLYDNALLLRLYAHHWRSTGNDLSRRIATETAGFLLEELRTAEGGFASSLDADSDGAEGRFYVWTRAELERVLGAGDAGRAAELFGVTDEGTFEHGSSVLQLAEDPADRGWYEDVRLRLRTARSGRPRPARDDKVVTAWNGLAITALAEASVLFETAELLQAARGAARLLLDVHLQGDRLLRTSREGVAGSSAGVLEDYADLAEGLLALHQADGELEWLTAAGTLLAAVVERFGDGAGGFFDTAGDAETLIRRPRDPTDNVTPSGAAAAAGALLGYAALTGEAWPREVALAALAGLRPLVAGHPRFAGWAAAVGEAAIAGPLEIAVVGAPELARVARMATSPGAVTVTQGAEAPLLAGRPAGFAYVCRGFACEAPVADPGQLATLVRARV